MKIHIICVAYQKLRTLRVLVDCIKNQTNPNWTLKVIHDGKPRREWIKLMDSYTDKRIERWESKERYNCYGHPNRDAMLKKIKGNKDDFVLITNDDNYYVPKFAEFFIDKCTSDVGIVYCDTVHSHFNYDTFPMIARPVELKEKRIDMGAFIVRLDIAQETGFNHTHFSADGVYAEECYAECTNQGLRTVYISKALFIHN